MALFLLRALGFVHDTSKCLRIPVHSQVTDLTYLLYAEEYVFLFMTYTAFPEFISLRLTCQDKANICVSCGDHAAGCETSSSEEGRDVKEDDILHLT